MSDEFGNSLATAILIEGMVKQGQSQQYADKERALKQEQEKLEKSNKNLVEENRNLADDSISSARAILMLRREIEYYKQVLAAPMHVIAKHEEDFRKTYEEEQANLAAWMVSQKAFKELAVQFGMKLGLDYDQVIQMGKEMKLDVLDNKNDSAHGSNANGIPMLEKYTRALKEEVETELERLRVEKNR